MAAGEHYSSARMVPAFPAIMGHSGAGDVPAAALPEAIGLVWSLLAAHKLEMDVEAVPLSAVAEAWTRATGGKRLVLVP